MNYKGVDGLFFKKFLIRLAVIQPARPSRYSFLNPPYDFIVRFLNYLKYSSEKDLVKINSSIFNF